MEKEAWLSGIYVKQKEGLYDQWLWCNVIALWTSYGKLDMMRLITIWILNEDSILALFSSSIFMVKNMYWLWHLKIAWDFLHGSWIFNYYFMYLHSFFFLKWSDFYLFCSKNSSIILNGWTKMIGCWCLLWFFFQKRCWNGTALIPSTRCKKKKKKKEVIQ